MSPGQVLALIAVLVLLLGLSAYLLTGFIAWLVDRARGISRP